MKPTLFDRMCLDIRTVSGETNDADFWGAVTGAVPFYFDNSARAAIDVLLLAKPALHGDMPFERIFIEDERDAEEVWSGIYVEAAGPRSAIVSTVAHRGDCRYGATTIGRFEAAQDGGLDAVIDDDGRDIPIGELLHKSTIYQEDILRWANGDDYRANAADGLLQTIARLNLLAMPPSLVEREEIDVRAINRKRRLMNRPPITTKTIVRLKPGGERLIAKHLQGGHHQPSRPLHAVRGHLRRLESGKITHVRPHRRGDARFGVRLAEYRVSGPASDASTAGGSR